MVGVIVKLDRNGGQARCPLDQLNFVDGGTARNAAVHLQGSQQFVILGKNACETEAVQTKLLCVPSQGSKIGCTVIPQGNQRNHVANSAIESAADSIQEFREGRSG
jgi:hypothetical protein